MNPAAPMAADRRDILMVGHEATRTGAPMIMLHFLRWLTATKGMQYKMLFIRGGEMVREFAVLGNVLVLHSSLPWKINAACRRSGLSRIPGIQRLTDRLVALCVKRWIGRQPAVTYMNSIASAPVAAFLPVWDCPLICHVHELSYVFAATVTESAWQTLQRRTTLFVAASQAVERFLTDERGIQPDRVRVVYGFVPVDKDRRIDESVARSKLRDRLGLPANARIVGGAGTLEWRKGPDLFLQVARALLARRESDAAPIYFLWIGGELPEIGRQVRYDADGCGLADRVRFIGPASQPMQFFAGIDLFLLTSREDPFPLVCLEAASVGRPIICFAGSGGMPEFTRGDAGVAVPYLDVDTMAQVTAQLLDDLPARARAGQTARDRAIADHDIAVVAPRLWAILADTIARNGSRSQVL